MFSNPCKYNFIRYAHLSAHAPTKQLRRISPLSWSVCLSSLLSLEQEKSMVARAPQWSLYLGFAELRPVPASEYNTCI